MHSGRNSRQTSTRTVTRLGIRVEDWSVPGEGEARLMAHPWLEALTRTYPIAPLALFAPVVALILSREVARDVPFLQLVGLIATGVALWTLTEYAIHRFVLHLRPRRRTGIALAYLVHGVHHAYPSDRRRLVMSPMVTVPLAAAFYAVLVTAAGVRIGEGLYAGLLAGYVAYDSLHFAIHASSARIPGLATLRRNHMLHHFRVPDRRFGVSTTVWDHLFGTR